MIVEYHRPKTIESALQLLTRKNPRTVPLGGGTVLSQHAPDDVAVVDLQELPLKKIETQAAQLRIGATVTLQTLVESPVAPEALRQAAALEANINLRQAATVAGALVAADGRSPLATVLAAMDSILIWQPGEVEILLSEWLPQRQKTPAVLITQVRAPLEVEVKAEFVGRTPVDVPLVGAAVCRWKSGRVRVCACGFGEMPLVVFDGDSITSIDSSIDNACSQYSSIDNYQYKLQTTKTLTRRLLESEL